MRDKVQDAIPIFTPNGMLLGQLLMVVPEYLREYRFIKKRSDFSFIKDPQNIEVPVEQTIVLYKRYVSVLNTWFWIYEGTIEEFLEWKTELNSRHMTIYPALL